MKIAKILSAATAAVAAVSAIAVSASATLTTVDQSRIFFSGTGMCMPVLFSDGPFDAADKDVTDVGINCQDIASISVAFTPAEKDWWEGEVGGSIVLSNKSATDDSHNWIGKNFWGVTDYALNITSADVESNPLAAYKIGDYTYAVTCPVDDSNNVVDNYALVQVAFQEWSAGMTDITILGMEINDAAGNTLVYYDANGNATVGSKPAGAVDFTPVANEAPAEDGAASDGAATDGAATDAAPSDTASDATNAGATDTKGSPDTGVEGVAAVAGVAIVAAGAVVLSKKRK